MNKWRLLLFSVFGLLQITTSDRFIDGREQCCNHRVSRSDTRLSTYEPYRFSSELRQLKSPDFRRIDQEKRSIRGYIRRESPQDENRRGIENRGIRELTDVTERGITRARSYEDRRISPGNAHRDALVNRDRQLELNTRSTITRDDHRRNYARNHLENRDNTRKRFATNAREERFNVRRDISEREERKVSRLASIDRNINTDYDKESRNTMQNTRHVRIVRANRDDSDRRVLQNARRETFETRIVNNLDDRVSRLRSRRSSLEDLRETDVLSFRVRSARNYDNAESRNNADINQGNQNREEIQNENRDRISRKNGRDNSLHILRERFTTEYRLSERANDRNIRLGKRGISEETERNIKPNMYTGDSSIIAKAGSREYRGTDIQRESKNSERDIILNDRIRHDNNDNRLFRRTIAKDTLNIMERHIQVDDSRIPGHFRNSRGNSEIRSNERIVRNRFDGIKRERTVRNEVWQERLNNMEESRIRSSSVPTYDKQNTREDVRSEIHRVKSNSAERRNFHNTGENHNSARRNTNKDAEEHRSRDLWQATNIRRQIDVSKRHRNTPTDNEVQKFEALDRIRSQSPQERRLTRDARDLVTREQNSRDESLHRIRSRSLEERFSMIQEERDEYKTRNIKANGETRQQPNPRDTRDSRISQGRSNERIARDRSDGIRRERTVRNDVRQEGLYDTEESRIRSSSTPKLNDNRNARDVSNEISRLTAERRNFHGMDERRVRRNTYLDASRYRSRELRQEQKIRRQIDISRMTENEVRKFRYNNNEALDGIHPQSPQDRRLTREARDLVTREQTSREESLHRIRSRSMEQSFDRVRNDRDEYKSRSIRANEESRQQRTRTAESISVYAPRVQNIRLSTNKAIRNSRYNDEEDFRQIRSIDTKERFRDARDTSDRTTIHDIRDSRIMQERQITPRERYESRIRIEFRDRSVSLPNDLRNSRNNNEESRRLKSRGIEERYLARKTTHEIISNIDARNTRNIREELTRDRSPSMKDKRDIRDEARIRTNYARTSEVRNTRDLETSRHRRERSTERLMDRNIRENRQNHENVERRTNLVRENREKLIIDSIRTIPMITKQSENYVYEIKWQYLFYALQGIYLCSLFMKISKDEQLSKKKLRTTSWLLPADYLKID